ncbi:CUE domain-containing protein [Plasmodiophora brassicae]
MDTPGSAARDDQGHLRSASSASNAFRLRPLGEVAPANDDAGSAPQPGHRRRTRRSSSVFDLASVASSTIPAYRLQGDLAMYTPIAMERRAQLAANQTVITCIDLIWGVLLQCLPDKTSSSLDPIEATVSFDGYAGLHVRICKALLRDYTEELAYRLSCRDWKHDVGLAESMSRAEFRRSMFEIVDQWTPRVDLHDYIDFLVELLTRIAEPADGADLDEILNGIMAALFENDTPGSLPAIPKMKLRDVDAISSMQRDPAGQWTPKTPGAAGIDKLLAQATPAHLGELGRAAIDNDHRREAMMLAEKDPSAIAELLRTGRLTAQDLSDLLARGAITKDQLMGLLLLSSGDDTLLAAIETALSGNHSAEMSTIRDQVTAQRRTTLMSLSTSNTGSTRPADNEDEEDGLVNAWNPDDDGKPVVTVGEGTTSGLRQLSRSSTRRSSRGVLAPKRSQSSSGRQSITSPTLATPARRPGRRIQHRTPRVKGTDPVMCSRLLGCPTGQEIDRRVKLEPHPAAASALKWRLYRRLVTKAELSRLVREAPSVTGADAIVWDVGAIGIDRLRAGGSFAWIKRCPPAASRHLRPSRTLPVLPPYRDPPLWKAIFSKP